MINVSGLILALCFLGAHSHSIRAAVGTIKNLRAEDITLNGMVIKWELTEATNDLIKCTLTRDKFFNEDVICQSPTSCLKHEENLKPCTTYEYELTCFYLVDENLSETEKSKLSADTKQNNPGEITGLKSHNGEMITWDEEKCSSKYEFCYHIRGSSEKEHCEMVTDPSFNLKDVSLCSTLDIRVHGVNENNQKGPTATTVIYTENGVPGPPRNVKVNSIGETEIMIIFDEPEENPQCADQYSVVYGETHGTKNNAVVYNNMAVVPYNIHHHNISDLNPCTNYTIDVIAVSPENKHSPKVTLYTATADSEPLPPGKINVVPNSDGTISIEWVAGDKCSHDFELCFVSGELDDDCQSSNGDHNMTYGPLEPCKVYQVIITPSSPSGIIGMPSTIFTDPIDAQPSNLQNYGVTETTATSMTVYFDEPEVNAECIDKYIVEYKNLDDISSLYKATTSHSHTEDYKDLEACCTYNIRHQAVTFTGLVTDWSEANATLKEATPSVPRQISCMDSQATKNSVYLQWYRPTEFPYCVNNYEITYATNKKETVESIPGVFQIRHQIHGLEKCKTYEFQIKAIAPSGAQSKPDSMSCKTACDN